MTLAFASPSRIFGTGRVFSFFRSSARSKLPSTKLRRTFSTVYVRHKTASAIFRSVYIGPSVSVFSRGAANPLTAPFQPTDWFRDRYMGVPFYSSRHSTKSIAFHVNGLLCNYPRSTGHTKPLRESEIFCGGARRSRIRERDAEGRSVSPCLHAATPERGTVMSAHGARPGEPLPKPKVTCYGDRPRS